MTFTAMNSPRGLVLAAMVVLFGAGVPGPADPAAKHEESEEQIRAKFDRETNPVKKAKLEIRLGRVKLEQALDACVKDEHDRCHDALVAYLQFINSSWERLRSTGRRADKQPQGFKELDIALREDSRMLDDLLRQVAVEDRDPIREVKQETDRIHNEVFGALFPGGKLPTSQGSSLFRRTGVSALGARHE